jgi:hypothetical protein
VRSDTAAHTASDANDAITELATKINAIATALNTLNASTAAAVKELSAKVNSTLAALRSTGIVPS